MRQWAETGPDVADLYDDDPDMDVPMWRALDLQRAYAYRDRVVIATLLSELNETQLAHACTVLIGNYNDDLRGLSRLLRTDVSARALLREVDHAAALAPAEHEFAVTTAVRDVAHARTDMTTALAALDTVARAHLLASYITAMTNAGSRQPSRSPS